MFRRQEDTLEADPSFKADLKSLGFFINKVGHIRMVEAPEKPYIFHATNNERVNEVRREAMQECQREASAQRLSALGLNRIYLPEFSTIKPNGPHIPILAPSPETLGKRKRVIVLVNSTAQDLGILAYRQLQRELGINGGSVVNFAKELIRRSAVTGSNNDEALFDDAAGIEKNCDVPGLLVMNTGQLLYSHKHNKAMTMRSWSAMPRKSIAHDRVHIHWEQNLVHGHCSALEHFKSVFDEVLCNSERVSADAEVYLIAIEDGTETVVKALSDDFEKYGSRVTAMAMIDSFVDDSQVHNPDLRAFLHKRTRHWRYSDVVSDPRQCVDLPDDYSKGLDGLQAEAKPAVEESKRIRWNEEVQTGALSGITKTLSQLILNTTPANPVEGTAASQLTPKSSILDTDWSTGQSAICPTFAGGDNPVGECIFTNQTVQQAIISFFDEVAQDPENYRNPLMKMGQRAPQPTPDNPLSLSPLSSTEVAQTEPLPVEMMPEYIELDDARQTLQDMRIALAACPVDNQEVAKGRERLIKKIQVKSSEIGDLEKKVLASGGLKAGEGIENRENWKPQKEGTKVKFAGTMVDSELLKAAGLVDTANEALEKRDGDDEKAFI